MHCFPTEVENEKINRQNPLLFEWDVTSTQITSGHGIKNLNASNKVHAIEMNNMSVAGMLCSLCSTLAHLHLEKPQP